MAGTCQEGRDGRVVLQPPPAGLGYSLPVDFEQRAARQEWPTSVYETRARSGSRRCWRSCRRCAGGSLIDTNRWNRLRYTFWAPVYDLAVRGMDRKRRESLSQLDPRPGERLLIVGAGTGADLPHLPGGCTVLATDLTPAMLRRARPRAGGRTHLAVMDGHQLAVPDGAFDGVVLHLVLAVIPDPVRCLREVARALRPGGRVAVFDKFVRTRRPPLALRALNVVIRVLFTDMTRRFEDILERSGADLVVVRDEPAFAGGLYRRLLLRRAGEPPAIATGAVPPLLRRP